MSTKRNKAPNPYISKLYQPVMDWWVAVIIFLILALFISAIPVVVWSPIIWYGRVIAVIPLLLIILFIVDSMFFTRYLLSSEGLLIHSQLRSYLFPYRAMQGIQQGGILGLFSLARTKRFSLSANCYYIVLANQGWKRISVSPRKRDQFIQDLLENIETERASRSTVDA